MIRAVLLRPAGGDPHGLLADGPCAARPPYAYRDCADDPAAAWVQGGNPDDPGEAFGPVYTGEEALVLAWDGKPVHAGLDWWWRCVGGMNLAHPSTWCSEIAALTDDVMHEPWLLGGHLVFLDAEGREVTP
jgi:hypothetical protein